MTTSLLNSLNEVLTGTYALMALTHSAHWNVEGPDFFQLHKAFDDQYNELFGAVDLIAERIRALGAYAMPQPSALGAKINELPKLTDSTTVAGVILQANIQAVEWLTTAKAVATNDNDLETQNLLIERITAHQKVIWMLKAYSLKA
jgi:starvation-inducible DNA-binding protein